MMREQFRRFADDRVVPHAHGWHLADELIPMEVVDEMAELGVFGLTLPEEWPAEEMGPAMLRGKSEPLNLVAYA